MQINPTIFPETETTFLISGPSGDLELLTTPTKTHVNPIPAVAIICHPHPLYGGTMHNKVVTTLMRVFADLGLRTVRFNFRGIGKSTGSYAEGLGETEDLFAVMEWVKKTCPTDAIWLAGFSFGAAISARAAAQTSVAQLVSIAPPVPRFSLIGLPPITCPWLVVQGEQDEVIEPEAVFAWIDTLNPKPRLIRMPGASHFFHGQLLELRRLLETALG